MKPQAVETPPPVQLTDVTPERLGMHTWAQRRVAPAEVASLDLLLMPLAEAITGKEALAITRTDLNRATGSVFYKDALRAVREGIGDLRTLYANAAGIRELRGLSAPTRLLLQTAIAARLAAMMARRRPE